MAQEEKPATSTAKETHLKPSNITISTSHRWFSQLLVIAARSQFINHNLNLWARHIQTILRPRDLMDHLTDIAPPKIASHHNRWIVEEEVLHTWALDSMSTKMVNHFSEYALVKEIWDAVHSFCSKKIDHSKIVQLVTNAWML